MPRFHATVDGNIPFTAQEELEADQREAEYLASLSVVKVPQSITKVQAMRAMKQTDIDPNTGASMWDSFKALLAYNTDANDEWLLAPDLQRNHPLVIALAPSLGKTEAQIDDLFILGATL